MDRRENQLDDTDIYYSARETATEMSKSKGIINQFVVPSFHDNISHEKRNDGNSNSNSNGNSNHRTRTRSNSSGESSDYTLATYDVANSTFSQSQQQVQGSGKRNGRHRQSPQTGTGTQIGTQTGDVDVIGILNSSTTSLAPSDIFKRSSKKIRSSTPTGGGSSRFRPPPSPTTFRKKVQPQQQQYQMHHVSYQDMSTAEFPTIEVRFGSSSSLLSLGKGTGSNINVEGTTHNNNSQNSINMKRPSTPPVSGAADNDAPPVSPLTPKGEEEEPKKKHRRMSSSERLLKMLDEMNKKKPFDIQDDDNDDDGDYDDDDDGDYNDTFKGVRQQRGRGNGNSGGGSGKASNTTPSRTISHGTTRGRGLYAGGNDEGGSSAGGGGNNSASSIFTPTSTSGLLSASKKNGYSSIPQRPGSMKRSNSRKNNDPTLYAQSFVLSIAFFCVWSPQNLMAPNLTQMAEYFHFTPDQRDLYLGANIALATGVLSLPVSAMLGFLADIVKSRIKLFAGTVCCGGISAILTGLSVTYTQLYFARFCCGGCMAGSVVIAFSILGDLFDAKDRNAASSGLTAMMGSGILLGQVLAGTVGDVHGWKVPFYISGICSIVTSFMVLMFVSDPVRGGKEKVLQDMIANGTKYDRKLTVKGFVHAMTKNKTNVILMLQGLFTNVPWGIIFTFLNDYLSQEAGLSVPASTFLVLWFGIGSALGGVFGGFCGSWCMRTKRSLLPFFMAMTTLLGILPFLGLLNIKFPGPDLFAIFLALSGGCIANLPSVNVRPCILNVNPPETRGAAMTANNLMVNVARGAGPSLITLSQKFFGVSRQQSFNVALIVFWSITTLLLFILVKTLPDDQDAMEAELASYAESKVKKANRTSLQFSLSEKYKELDSAIFDDSDRFRMLDDNMTQAGEESIVSIEDRMTSFDAAAAQESWTFIEEALREIAELSHIRSPRGSYEGVEIWDGGSFDGDNTGDEERGRRDNLGEFETN